MNINRFLFLTEELSLEVEQAANKSAMKGPLVAVIVFFSVLILGGLAFAFYIMWKQKNGEMNGSDNVEEGISSKAKTTAIYDSKRLVERIERVEDGIIVTDNGKRFIAGITCRGLDFYNEGAREQLSVMRGYQSFLNIVTKPITYRLYSKEVDIDQAKNRYEKRYEELSEELSYATKQLTSAVDRGLSKEEISFCEQNVKNYENRLKHLADQMAAMDFYSGSDVSSDITQTYIFDWTYEPDMTENVSSDGRIFLRAKAELEATANHMITALSSAGVKARMCTQEEMWDAIRRNSRPVTAEQYRQRFVADFSERADIVGSDSMEFMQKIVHEEEVDEMENALSDYINLFGGSIHDEED